MGERGQRRPLFWAAERLDESQYLADSGTYGTMESVGSEVQGFFEGFNSSESGNSRVDC
jgi:hypothetical protein